MEARARRESGWSLIRASWLDGIDDRHAAAAYDPELPLDRAYEKSVARADDVGDRLRHEADRVARHAGMLSEKRRLAEETGRIRSEQEAAAADRAALERSWQKLWEPCGLEPMRPAEMRAWLGRHQDLCVLLRRSRECSQRVDFLRSQAEELRTELSRELAGLGEEPAGELEGLAALLDRSRRVL